MEPHPQEEVERVTCALEGHVGAVNALALWGPYVASAGGDAMVGGVCCQGGSAGGNIMEGGAGGSGGRGAMVGGAWIGGAYRRGERAVRCQCWRRCHGRTGLKKEGGGGGQYHTGSMWSVL